MSRQVVDGDFHPQRHENPGSIEAFSGPRLRHPGGDEALYTYVLGNPLRQMTQFAVTKNMEPRRVLPSSLNSAGRAEPSPDYWLPNSASRLFPSNLKGFGHAGLLL